MRPFDVLRASASGSAGAAIPVSTNRVYVVVDANTTVRVYRHVGSSRWAEYQYGKYSQTSPFFNGWRTDSIWLCQPGRDGNFYRLAPVTVRQLITSQVTSESDMAIQVTGAADFVGGAVHGYDVVSGTTFALNGRTINSAVSGNYSDTGNFVLTQTGTLYIQGSDVTNSANKLVDYVKTITITPQGTPCNIQADMTWRKNTTIGKGFVGMMPLSGNADTTYGQGFRYTRFGGAGAYTDMTAGGTVSVTDVDTRDSFGDISGLAISIQATTGWTTYGAAFRANYVQITSNLYKHYFSFVGGGADATVTDGLQHTFKLEHTLTYS